MQTQASAVPDMERTAALRRQRNLFAAVAACLIASTGLALPRKVADHRELRVLQARLVFLQHRIGDYEIAIREAEHDILGAQEEIKRGRAR